MAKKGSSGLVIVLVIIAALGGASWFFWPEIKGELRQRDLLPERLQGAGAPAEKAVHTVAPEPQMQEPAAKPHQKERAGAMYALSISDPSGRLAKAGRIMQFEMKLHGYNVVSVNVPKGWEVSVVNDSVSLVKGRIVVGAAAVETGGIRDLLVVEKIAPKPGVDAEVYTTRDFERKEKHAVEEKEIALKRM